MYVNKNNIDTPRHLILLHKIKILTVLIPCFRNICSYTSHFSNNNNIATSDSEPKIKSKVAKCLLYTLLYYNKSCTAG